MMSDLISSELNKQELHELATDTIDYCADGKITYGSGLGKSESVTLETTAGGNIELTSSGDIYINRWHGETLIREYVFPDELQSLFILFESMTDNYNDRNKE